MIKNKEDKLFISLVGNEMGRPVLFPYGVIPALNEMKATGSKVFIYIYRLINGFRDRESVKVSTVKIAERTGLSRRSVSKTIHELSSPVNEQGKIRPTYLNKKDRGIKKSYEYNIVFPGCKVNQIENISPESIENLMFSVPLWFFDGYIINGIKNFPLKNWNIIDIQLFFRICALHAQKEFEEKNLKKLTNSPIKIRNVILPPMIQRISRISPSLKKLEELGLLNIAERTSKTDDFLFTLISPKVSDYSSNNEPHEQDDKLPRPEISHDSGNPKPEISHGKPEISHDIQIEAKPEYSHGKPEISHGKPEILHDSNEPRPEISHGKPEITHIDSVVVVSLKDITTTEPVYLTNKFSIEIKETGDQIKCSIPDAVKHSMKKTETQIESKGRYSGSLFKKSKKGIVIFGDGSTYFDIGDYIRQKINTFLIQETEKIRIHIQGIITAGNLPKIMTKEDDGKVCYIQDITSEKIILTRGIENEKRKTVYGNEASIFLLDITNIEHIEKKELTQIEMIKEALNEGKEIKLKSKQWPTINIVDCVGDTLITVTDGEKGDLDDETLFELQKPIFKKGKGYQLEISGEVYYGNEKQTN